MKRRGRPRKTAVRMPSVARAGGPSPREERAGANARYTQDHHDSLKARMRVYGIAEADAASPLLASPEGRMCLERLIDGRRVPALLTPRQREAATRYRQVLLRQARANGAPKGPGTTWTQWLPANAPAVGAAEEAAAKAAFARAHHALRQAGRGAVAAVEILCRDDQEPPSHRLSDLRRGLDALVDHFGLDRMK